MKMKPYISLDLETTGICPETCQVIEVGGVFDFPDRPLADCPRFHTYVRHKLYVGEPFALAMNQRIFKILADPKTTEPICCLDDVPVELAAWIKRCGWDMDERKFSFAGKNFGGFDRGFLRRVPLFDQIIKYKHRHYYAGNMYFDPRIDEDLPSTEQCLQRAGLPASASHEAVADAVAVAALVRARYGIPI